MALCTRCGAIFNDADLGKHVCKSANIPAPSKEKIPSTSEVSL